MAAITPEQYNRICRLLQHGITPKLTFDIETEYQKDDLMGFNVVGEIPGTSKADEVVMVGGHFDSWQGGTGTTRQRHRLGGGDGGRAHPGDSA